MKRMASILLALTLALALTACGGNSGGIKAKDGYGEGKIGDVMQSYFFDFTVNSVALQDAYESHTPGDGEKVLVVNVTVANTFAKNARMSKDDIAAGNADVEMCMTQILRLSGTEATTRLPFPLPPTPTRLKNLTPFPTISFRRFILWPMKKAAPGTWFSTFPLM